MTTYELNFSSTYYRYPFGLGWFQPVYGEISIRSKEDLRIEGKHLMDVTIVYNGSYRCGTISTLKDVECSTSKGGFITCECKMGLMQMRMMLDLQAGNGTYECFHPIDKGTLTLVERPIKILE